MITGSTFTRHEEIAWRGGRTTPTSRLGCCAAYYPETNPLVPLYARDPLSFTPSYKGIPIRLARSAASGAAGSPLED